MSQKTNAQEENNVLQLQNIMFDTMKRLSDPNADLEKEIKRAQAISAAGTVVINAAKVQIDAVRVHALKNKAEKNNKQLTNGPK